MKSLARTLSWCAVVSLALVMTAAAKEKPKDKVCSNLDPQQLCTAQNTCGSDSEACTVEVKRSANSTDVMASTAQNKANTVFCVKEGTTVTWKTSSKNTGFVIDVTPVFPFDQGEAIVGGSDRAVTLKAVKAGCYQYSAGACVSGAIYGMCKTATGNLIVTK